VKLLLDANLSVRLVKALQDHFPGSTHVQLQGLSTARDTEIWEFAASAGFAILSKDSDFHQLSFLRGAPPKVIWVRLGNCSTSDILNVVVNRTAEIAAFDANPEAAFLILGWRR
jgi:predicted nuclease of predicted toxin-antitoxin system